MRALAIAFILAGSVSASAAISSRHSYTPVKEAKLAQVSDFKKGFLTEEEALLESQEDVGEFLSLFPQLESVAGTYGGDRGAPYRSFNDIWSFATQEKLQYFRMILLYNVAASGPSAQTLRIFTRPAGSNFDLTNLNNWNHNPATENWQISSGADGKMKTFTGLFKIHPERITLQGSAWRANDPMPHSMYLHYRYCARERMKNGTIVNGRWAGVATHGTPFERRLGNRASSGCLRLSLKNAATLFNRVKSEFRGQVPDVNYCVGNTQLESGALLEMVRDGSGRPVLSPGYQVLFVIVDDPNLR